MLVFSLVFPAGTALATHTGYTLDVEPEEATRVTGTTHTMTATISGPQSHDVGIDAELEEGSDNDQDGTTYGTPDIECTIPAGATQCILEYVGTTVGEDTIRAWIDYDDNNNTVEADRNESREEDAEPSAADVAPQGTGCENPGTAPTASADPKLPNSTTEPDCTDVVEVTWVSGTEDRPTTLDCDDSTGPDTERDVNPHDEGDASSETYTCTVRDQDGDEMNAILVKAEVENGVNDPDLTDGASYDRPDYTCTTRNPSTTGTGSTRNCTITVTQNEGEQGKALICFWVGDGPTGANLCAAEATGEGQTANPPFGGDGTGNDLADKVEKAWHEYELDCDPETDTNPVGTSHTVECTVYEIGATGPTPGSRARAGNIRVDVEASGANDPLNDGDTAQSRRSPDFTCTTSTDDQQTPTTDEGGTCTFTHGGTGTGSTTNTGVTLYRAWIDVDNNDNTDEADAAEGRDESTQPGEELEPDDTDVVEKRWTAQPTGLTITPETDTAPVGSCNAYTITTTSGSNNETRTEGVIVDVEQRHERSSDGTANNEPRVSFCTPGEGPNPSPVDETRGDLRPPQEDPDNPGTAGGETTRPTDAQGQVTIGIMVTPANGSDGTGRVDIVAFFDPNENDDPDSGEPQDTATKNWVASQARSIDCEPETATNATGTQHVVTCTVRNSSGQPVQGEGVTFTESGPGTINPTQANTDQNGQARTTATSGEAGQQTITGTITSDTQGNEPSEVDECDRAANDPQGSTAGECSDSVTKTWVASQARSIDCEPETATNPTGTQHVVTCTVRNASGQPAAGEGVTFTETGPGAVSPTQATTNSNGQATTTATSTEGGTQTITGTITADTQGTEPSEVDECDRAANDPSGSAQGVCSDSVEKTWIDEPECSDDIDNDNDGQTDFPNDDDCESATDDSEADQFPEQEFGGETGQEVTEGACTGFRTGSVQENPNGDGIVVVGTNGPDALQGSDRDDLICALGGDDAVQGHAGDDSLFGGGGKDGMEAGVGNDNMFGEGDKDILVGNEGNDEIDGGQGNDNMSGSGGQDTMYGRGGWDTLKGNADDDLLVGAKGRDVLQGGGGNDVARAGADDDVLKGYVGNDTLRGGGGDDIIKASKGRDRLFGNSGNDILNGGPGRDRCRGGRGRDITTSCP